MERTAEHMSTVLAAAVNQRRLAGLTDDPCALSVALRASMKRSSIANRGDIFTFLAPDERSRLRCADHVRANASAFVAHVPWLRRLAHSGRRESQDRFRARDSEIRSNSMVFPTVTDL